MCPNCGHRNISTIDDPRGGQQYKCGNCGHTFGSAYA